MIKIRTMLGKAYKTLAETIFDREDFCYAKILQIHTQEQSKIAGTLLRSQPFLYLLPYNSYIRECMWSLKFRHNKQVAELFGVLLADILPEYIYEWYMFEDICNPLVISVPSSKKTLLKRGYEQNHLILSHMHKHIDSRVLTYIPRVLEKKKNIPKQSRTNNRQERLKNPQGAFAVANAHLSTIKDRNIILFDDILTTGATTKEIVRVLKDAGVRNIKIVVIAH